MVVILDLKEFVILLPHVKMRAKGDSLPHVNVRAC
jgi:hypothetical protein